MACFFLPVLEFPGPSNSWLTGTETKEWPEEECGPSNPQLELTGCLNLVVTALTCAVGQIISSPQAPSKLNFIMKDICYAIYT